MTLRFTYPTNRLDLPSMLAIRAYETIWQNNSDKIMGLFHKYTGLDFQQDVIEVEVHDAQSMSGHDGVPMHLNLKNHTLSSQRNALLHELAHRLLFGNGLYAPDTPKPNDNDEIRVHLFLGDVLMELYGEEDYNYWANTDPEKRTKDHIKDMAYVLSLNLAERAPAVTAFKTQAS